MADKTIAVNRRARRDYHVLESFEAGLALTGTEVKSLRNGKLQLKDSYVEPRNGELYLVNAHIPPYEFGNIHNHEPERPRKLLVHKREIERLVQQVAEKGIALVPLKVYFTRGVAKLELGLCKGKARSDKRQTIQEREAKIEMDRAVKEARKR